MGVSFAAMAARERVLRPTAGDYLRRPPQKGNNRVMRRLAIAVLLVGLIPAESRGDGSLVAGDVLRVRSGGPLTVDGGLVLALPTALGPGLSTGFGFGVTRGRLLAWEARASWSTATE